MSLLFGWMPNSGEQICLYSLQFHSKNVQTALGRGNSHKCSASKVDLFSLQLSAKRRLKLSQEWVGWSSENIPAFWVERQSPVLCLLTKQWSEHPEKLPLGAVFPITFLFAKVSLFSVGKLVLWTKLLVDSDGEFGLWAELKLVFKQHWMLSADPSNLA